MRFQPQPFAICALVAACSSTAAELEQYAVPSYDYEQLDVQSMPLLASLQEDGIVSIKNIPSYASLRAAYLKEATQCAMQANTADSDFLLYRELQDGTQRYTISTEAGQALADNGKETIAACPDFLPLYHAFSQLVEHSVKKVGETLDRASFRIRTSQLTTAELFKDAVHLDHFHAYEAPQRSLMETNENNHELSDLSLELHTDNGLMIAMSAPAYFDINGPGKTTKRETDELDAGLLIVTGAGKLVRPVLRADELILMMGSGIDQWIQTSPRLHPVMHGMKYPRQVSYTNADGHKVLRAWFGKMILLPKDHVMTNTGMTYGQYANETTRFLREHEQDTGFMTVACPPHRRLAASDEKCMMKTCKPKPDSGAETELKKSCQITCNHKGDEENCTKYCDCEEATVAGHVCWMLCVADLPSSECEEQKCNGAKEMPSIARVCANNASTEEPAPDTTPSPSPEDVAATFSPRFAVLVLVACASLLISM